MALPDLTPDEYDQLRIELVKYWNRYSEDTYSDFNAENTKDVATGKRKAMTPDLYKALYSMDQHYKNGDYEGITRAIKDVDATDVLNTGIGKRAAALSKDPDHVQHTLDMAASFWDSLDSEGRAPSDKGYTGPHTDKGKAAKAAQDAADEKDKADHKDVLKEFYDQMMGPLNMDDPYVKQIVNQASNAGMTQAHRQGVEGGLSIQNSQKTVTDALTAQTQQNRQLGLQAGQQLQQRDQFQYEVELQKYQAALAQGNANAAADAQKNAAMLSAGLGILGAGVGAATGVSGLGSAFSSAGAGIGLSTYSPYSGGPPPSYTPSTFGGNGGMSYTPPSGGGGGYKPSGGW